MRYKIGINIHAPQAKVYETLFDGEQSQHWVPNFWRKQLLKGKEGEAGVVYTYIVNINKPKTFYQELVSFEAPKSLVFCHNTNYYEERFTITLSQKGALVTFLSLEANIEFISFMSIFSVFPPIFFKSRRVTYLLSLKRYLERSNKK